MLGILNKHFSGSHIKMLTSFLFYLFISKHLLSLCGRSYTGLWRHIYSTLNFLSGRPESPLIISPRKIGLSPLFLTLCRWNHYRHDLALSLHSLVPYITEFYKGNDCKENFYLYFCLHLGNEKQTWQFQFQLSQRFRMQRDSDRTPSVPTIEHSTGKLTIA